MRIDRKEGEWFPVEVGLRERKRKRIRVIQMDIIKKMSAVKTSERMKN